MPTALIVEDDPGSREALAELAEVIGFDTRSSADIEGAWAEISTRAPDVILADLYLPDGSGLELLEVLEGDPYMDIIIVTGHATVETSVEALRRGARDYLTKPVDVARLQEVLREILEQRRRQEELRSLREGLRSEGRFGPLVGTSDAMRTVYDLIERVAPTQATVFVIGESGTGKELVARTLHQLSRRSGGPFLPINCGAISPNLIESELFGHEKGSFTGADRRHQGVFERADGGTLFLDEITETPMELQVKLLRVLETGKIVRVGGRDEIPVNVRVLTATNRDPDGAVREGKLREDLLYRLKVFPIQLPPLRDRDGDVELLSTFFLEQLNQTEGTSKQLSSDALDRLRSSSWPGNVRELRNAVHRAFILADDVIDEEDVPSDAAPADDGGGSGPKLQVRIGSSIADVERRLILASLDHFDGDKKRTAKTLGVSLKTLYNRLNDYKSQDEVAQN